MPLSPASNTDASRPSLEGSGGKQIGGCPSKDIRMGRAFGFDDSCTEPVVSWAWG